VKTVTSVGKIGNTYKKIQVNVGDNNGVLAITPPWQEIP
jgi:hypothetical protein